MKNKGLYLIKVYVKHKAGMMIASLSKEIRVKGNKKVLKNALDAIFRWKYDFVSPTFTFCNKITCFEK